MNKTWLLVLVVTASGCFSTTVGVLGKIPVKSVCEDGTYCGVQGLDRTSAWKKSSARRAFETPTGIVGAVLPGRQMYGVPIAQCREHRLSDQDLHTVSGPDQVSVVVSQDDFGKLQAEVVTDVMSALRLALGDPTFAMGEVVDFEAVKAEINANFSKSLATKKEVHINFVRTVYQVKADAWQQRIQSCKDAGFATNDVVYSAALFEATGDSNREQVSMLEGAVTGSAALNQVLGAELNSLAKRVSKTSVEATLTHLSFIAALGFQSSE